MRPVLAPPCSTTLSSAVTGAALDPGWPPRPYDRVVNAVTREPSRQPTGQLGLVGSRCADWA
jgi:hypothetical protein